AACVGAAGGGPSAVAACTQTSGRVGGACVREQCERDRRRGSSPWPERGPRMACPGGGRGRVSRGQKGPGQARGRGGRKEREGEERRGKRRKRKRKWEKKKEKGGEGNKERKRERRGGERVGA